MPYPITITVSDEKLDEIIDIINNRDLDASDGDVYLTIDEVTGNEKLLTYLLHGYIEHSSEDVEDIWSFVAYSPSSTL